MTETTNVRPGRRTAILTIAEEQRVSPGVELE